MRQIITRRDLLTPRRWQGKSLAEWCGAGILLRQRTGEELRAAPFGRIAFASIDLSGVADHGPSIIEVDGAVGQLLDQVLAG